MNECFALGNKRFEGKVVTALAESVSKNNEYFLSGHTTHNKLINFEGKEDLIGKNVKLLVTKAKTWSLDGRILTKKEELLHELKENEFIKQFKELEKYIETDNGVKKQIKELTTLQRSILKNGKEEDIKKYDEIISKFENDINIATYLNMQDEINHLFSNITTIIEEELSDL